MFECNIDFLLFAHIANAKSDDIVRSLTSEREYVVRLRKMSAHSGIPAT